MFRALLLIAMICQVLGCPLACRASLCSTEAVSRDGGCRCCQKKRVAEENLPVDEQDDSGTTCFCNSPVCATETVQPDNDNFSAPIATLVEPQLTIAGRYSSRPRTCERPPGMSSGWGLRLAVQSLLL
jgi:hypothetical protein